MCGLGIGGRAVAVLRVVIVKRMGMVFMVVVAS